MQLRSFLLSGLLLGGAAQMAQAQAYIVNGVASDVPGQVGAPRSGGQGKGTTMPFEELATISTINFDETARPTGFAESTALRNDYSAQGVTFSGPNDQSGGAVLDQDSNFGVSGYSAPNFLAFNIGAGLNGGGTPAGPETLTFSTPVSSVQISVGQAFSGGVQSATLTAFNVSNVQIATSTVNPTDVLQPLAVSSLGNDIARVVLSFTSSTLVADDLTFSMNDTPLPVELQGFVGSVRNSAVELTWTTASEQINAGFVLFRDGQVIASPQTTPGLVGHGTTAQAQRYGFTDTRVRVGETHLYQLRSVDVGGSTHDYAQRVTVEVRAGAAAPAGFALSSASPNPFNPTTQLQLTLPEASTVRATLFNLLGQPVRTVVAGLRPAGTAPLTVDAAGLSSGIYMVRVTAQGTTQAFSQTERVVLMR